MEAPTLLVDLQTGHPLDTFRRSRCKHTHLIQVSEDVAFLIARASQNISSVFPLVGPLRSAERGLVVSRGSHMPSPVDLHV